LLFGGGTDWAKNTLRCSDGTQAFCTDDGAGEDTSSYSNVYSID
jgi:hypothetical protein